jgi:Type IV pili methyl-accepting chemotaxis transducer N-term
MNRMTLVSAPPAALAEPAARAGQPAQPGRRPLLGLAAALALGALLTPVRPARAQGPTADPAQALAQSQAQSPAAYGALIDLAGSQRMLTQRIVKAYCQIGLGVSREVAREQLAAAVQRFEAQHGQLRRQLEALPAPAGPDGPQHALGRVDKTWRGLRRVATGPVSRQAAARLSRLSDAVLQASQDLVFALQEAAGTPQARLVNMAGRERMLSQRLAKLYMLRAWGVDSTAQRDTMESASHEFAGALEALRAAEVNTPEIRAELDAVTLQWEWFRSALTLQGTESYAAIVADASEAILNSMDVVTARYAALSGA